MGVAVDPAALLGDSAFGLLGSSGTWEVASPKNRVCHTQRGYRSYTASLPVSFVLIVSHQTFTDVELIRPRFLLTAVYWNITH